VFFYNGASQTITQITDDSNGDNLRPVVSGENIAWYGGHHASREIFYFDGTSTTQLTDNSWHDTRPQISGDKIAWTGQVDDQDTEVFYYDETTQIVTQLTDNNLSDGGISISGDQIAWVGRTTASPASGEIFVYDTVTQTTT